MFITLVIEDNRDFRELLVDVLQAEFPDMRVVGAPSAERALKEVEKRPPDLVFVDIKLPGMNGLELVKILRKSYRQMVVVILTSHDTPEYRAAAAKHKVDHFLLKGSSTRTEILDLVRSVIVDKPTI